MYYKDFNYKEETKRIADELHKNHDVFIAMYNDIGEVKIRTFVIDNEFNFLYDGIVPFVKDIIANYFIFNDFSKTTLLLMDGDILSELEFDSLEELRMFYISEI